MAYYFDTSALMKLIVPEPESDALRDWIFATAGMYVSSDLTRAELIRATTRLNPDRMSEARKVLSGLALLAVSVPVCESAGHLDPPGMRSLDALHVASASSLGDDLDAVVTYDERMAEACEVYGISVLAPA